MNLQAVLWWAWWAWWAYWVGSSTWGIGSALIGILGSHISWAITGSFDLAWDGTLYDDQPT